MSGKKKYIEMFGSFMEPFNYKPKCAGSHAICPHPCARYSPAPAHTCLTPVAPSAPCFQ